MFTDTQFEYVFITSPLLISGKEKVLCGNCCAHFSTEPSGVALSLSDILKFFSDILPQRAMVVINGDVMDSAVLQLESDIVTVYGTTTEYSVIATTVVSSRICGVDTDGKMIVSLPNDLKIKVAAVKDQPSDEEMLEKTRDIYESFDVLNVKDLRRPCSSSKHSSQLHFYEEVGRGMSKPNVELKKPERVYAHLRSSSRLEPVPPYGSAVYVVETELTHAQSHVY